MVGKTAFYKIFEEVNGVIGYVPIQGNVGDSLIEIATLSLLRKLNIDYEVFDQKRLKQGKLPRHITRLFLSGGGNLGDLYPNTKELRRLACSKNRPVTVLPQSATNLNENFNQFDKIWVRERKSLEQIPGAHLAPDMALSLNLDSRANEARFAVAAFLREDKEGLFFDHRSSCGDPISLCNNIAAYLNLIAGYKHIVTDRLHFAIAALLMKRTVTLLPNSYFKNKAVWDTWLKKLGCFWAESPDQVQELPNRHAVRKIPEWSRFDISATDKISRTPGWKLVDKTLVCRSQDDQKTVSEIMVGAPIRALWNRLKTPCEMRELLSVNENRKGAYKYNRDRKLNIFLRRLFLMGAVEITPANISSNRSLRNTVGGRYGVPLEITLFPSVRINDDIFFFADFCRNRSITPIWYRVNKKHQKLLGNPADTILLSALQIAMWAGIPLWIKGGRADFELMRNLQQLQKIWSTWHRTFRQIEIHVKIRSARSSDYKSRNRVVSCFSGGVDSTFTLFNHTVNKKNHFKLPLTHALLVHGFDIPVENQAAFNDTEKKCQIIASALNLNLISISTNIRDMKMDWRKTHGTVIAGALHLVSKPFFRGLIPATLNYGILYPWGSTALTDPKLSTSAMSIVDDGTEYTRVDKIRAMRDWKNILDEMRFCPVAYPENHNCGVCGKCTMTAIMLILAGASRKSIKPFPSHRRIALQLMSTNVSRLDRSDLREEIENLMALNPSPNWPKLLLKQMEQAQR